MALRERRRVDLGAAARDPRGPPGPVRRGDRFRLRSTVGVAAALAIMSRQTGRLLPDESHPPVEVGTVLSQAPPDDRDALDALIEEAAAVHGISAPLVRAVIQAESAFDPLAVSPTGAQGLMQLMPITATLMGVRDPLDPRQNVFGGVKYLSQLLDRFGGNVALALAGYNAGPTNVVRYRGIPPYGETHGYVTKIRGILAESTGASFPLPKPAAIRSTHPAARRRARTVRTAELRRGNGNDDRRLRRSSHGRRS